MNDRTPAERKIIREMADEMLRLGDGCTERQMLLKFTQTQIDTYGEEARAIANRLSQREAA